MNPLPRRIRLYLWPRSLFHRLALILFSGLFAAHVLNFELVRHERAHVAQTIIADNLAQDIATTVALLERIPAAERATWLSRLTHRNYRYILGPLPDSGRMLSAQAQAWIAPVIGALGRYHAAVASAPSTSTDPMQLRLRLHLTDGTPLTVELSPSYAPHSVWVQVVLSVQLIMLAILTWIAVRLATRPLAKLAQAADALGLDLKDKRLPENGPLEVVRAAKAFNAMQDRITGFLAERIQILAAVSHDLQTPITRMRLRADLLDDAVLRGKLHGDLNAMQALVEQGIAYARSTHDVAETPCRIDLDALLDSLVCDYLDAGQTIVLKGKFSRPVITRPHTLRRIVINLADNALKFGDDAEILVESTLPDRVHITVRDRGPGIPATEMQAVLKPFYRVEASRNRESGGTGLGLAIAQQLTLALGGTLTLANREGADSRRS